MNIGDGPFRTFCAWGTDLYRCALYAIAGCELNVILSEAKNLY